MKKQEKIENKRKKKIKKEYIAGWLMGGLPVVGFILFGAIPIIYSFFLSFVRLNSYDVTKAVWVGLENYEFVLQDARFLKAIGNTLLFLISVPVNMALSLGMALLINKSIKGVKVFRTILFIPYVCSAVGVSTIWKWLYDTNYGVINDILSKFNIDPIPWLTDEKYLMLSVLIMSAWGGTGFGMLLYQSALNNVSDTLYEAAEIDGAGKKEKFFKITLPLISPTTFYMLVTGVIGALQNFVTFQIMCNDTTGPNEAGLTAVYYLYRMAFKDTITYGMGYASATAWILSVVIVILTVINFKVSERWVYSE